MAKRYQIQIKKGRRAHANVRPLGEALAAFLERKGLSGEMRLYQLIERWPELVGPQVARRTLPLQLKGGLLTVTVASSAWLNELSFMKAQLLQQINQGLGSQEVMAIRFVAGQVHARRPDKAKVTAPVASEQQDLTPELKDSVEEDLAEIDDPALRRAIRGARLAHLRRLKRLGQAGGGSGAG